MGVALNVFVTSAMLVSAASAAVLLVMTGLSRFYLSARRMRRPALYAAAGSYLTTSGLFLGLWGAFTPVSWWFVAFLTVAWPLWMASGLTGQHWLLEWLPGWIWLPR